jgi:copper oxidase (laccase) domain-containing protein
VDVAPEISIAFTPHKDRWLADIYQLARLALKRVGVEEVYGGQYYTHTQHDKFFSYRRNGVTGRMATVISIEA